MDDTEAMIDGIGDLSVHEHPDESQPEEDTLSNEDSERSMGKISWKKNIF